jgi:hypothetical protein
VRWDCWQQRPASLPHDLGEVTPISLAMGSLPEHWEGWAAVCVRDCVSASSLSHTGKATPPLSSKQGAVAGALVAALSNNGVLFQA